MPVDELLMKLHNVLGDELFDKLKSPYLTAFELHKFQKRKNGDPYIFHPLRVCLILADELKIRDIEILMVALLHDVIEDCDISYEHLEELYGSKIAKGVALLTKSEDFKDNIEAQNQYFTLLKRATRSIQLVKLADRLDNMRDLINAADKSWQQRYILDTSYNFLPWAKEISPYVYAEIEDLIFKYNNPAGDYID